MKASEYLALARDEIEKGWVRGTVQDGAGNVCAVGALRRVVEQNQPQGLDGFIGACTAGNDAGVALQMMIKEFGGNSYWGSYSVPSFNDTRKSKDEVLAWFEKAIIGLEERGQ